MNRKYSGMSDLKCDSELLYQVMWFMHENFPRKDGTVTKQHIINYLWNNDDKMMICGNYMTGWLIRIEMDRIGFFSVHSPGLEVKEKS